METLLILAMIGVIGILAAILDRTFRVWHFGSGFLLLAALAGLLWIAIQLDSLMGFKPWILFVPGHLLVLGSPFIVVGYLATKALFLFTWPRE